MTKYIGWVPTVGRRLSYSIIGNSSHPSVAETANVADNKKRRILCLQNRMLLDSALPIFKHALAKFFFSLSGSFAFFVDAESNNNFSSDDQSLIGKLYLFADKTQGFDDKILRIRNAISELNNFDAFYCPQNIEDFYFGIKDKYLQEIEMGAICKASFKLDRDGIIEIDIETDQELDEQTSEIIEIQASQEFDEQENEIIEIDTELDEQRICAQLFFFIKDISHRHQHHHPKTDTILDIYREDNPHWQDEAIRSLYKRVLDFKRSRNEWVCSSALGILSYIKAFKKVCDNRGMKITAGRDDDDLSESIKIGQDELRHASSQKVGFRNALITAVLAIIGAMLMLSSLGTIANPQIQISSKAEFIRFVSGNIVNNPLNTFLVVLIISLVFSTYIYKDYCLGRSSWFKDVTRLFMSIRSQFVSGVLMIIISAILAFGAYKALLI